jgi:hypothetical protein
MESELRGQRLELLLGMNALKLESVVELVKQGDTSVKEPKLEMTDFLPILSLAASMF